MQVSFLSLNLNSLNEQLAKVDEKDPFQKSAENRASKTDPAKPKDEIVLIEVAVASFEDGDNDGHADGACLSGLELKRQVKDKTHKTLLYESSPTGIEASQAEAELDMLLGSLGGTDVALQ